MERKGALPLTAAICILIAALSQAAHAQYGGGTGEPSDPYLINTPEQMNAIGADPNDRDKHFKLMADLDLSAYTGDEFNIIGLGEHGGMVRRSVRTLAQGVGQASFGGVFDGNGHMISNFTHVHSGARSTGLFRSVSGLNARIMNLGLVNPRVDAGQSSCVGALVGQLEYGIIEDCYVTGGAVYGGQEVGGLVGCCSYSGPQIRRCFSTAFVSGTYGVGGLVGAAREITNCWAGGTVFGDECVGGLVGGAPTVANCYALGTVIGNRDVGGLAGSVSSVENCYAAALVIGQSRTGGLTGGEIRTFGWLDEEVTSFWDTEVSMQSASAIGQGRTSAEMQTLATFFAWGQEGNGGVWTIDEGNDYPRLAWEHREGVAIDTTVFSDLFPGTGAPGDPFLIYNAAQLNLIGRFPEQWDKHYKLMADIDLSSYGDDEFNLIGGDREDGEIRFTGTFDGDGRIIAGFSYRSAEMDYVGLFRRIAGSSAEIKNLGLIAPDIDAGEGSCVGALAGYNWGATIRNCFVDGGIVRGKDDIGGLVGEANGGTIRECYTDAIVFGDNSVGGLLGSGEENTVRNCYVGGVVVGDLFVGGLVGYTYGQVIDCYANAAVIGRSDSGGLVGSGERVEASFWNVEISGQGLNDNGAGLTTAQMGDPNTFIAAGWDFFGPVDGPNDVWVMDLDRGMPILWWQAPYNDGPAFAGGAGTSDEPYLIASAEDLNSIGENPRLMESHFLLVEDIDLTGLAVTPIGSAAFPFAGVFDGNRHAISNLTQSRAGHPRSYYASYAGLFPYIQGGDARIENLTLIDPNIVAGTTDCVGALAGYLGTGMIANCCVDGGKVVGGTYTGGLVGYNDRGAITASWTTGDVAGSGAGGLVGRNSGAVTNCYARGSVTGVGRGGVGGLIGDIWRIRGSETSKAHVVACYAAGRVSGSGSLGGLVGSGGVDSIIPSFWDVETSGQRGSVGGTGRTTAHMQEAPTFLEAGWDFVGEQENGTDEIWWIEEGWDYPRLWWEGAGAEF